MPRSRRRRHLSLVEPTAARRMVFHGTHMPAAESFIGMDDASAVAPVIALRQRDTAVASEPEDRFTPDSGEPS